MSVKVMSTVVPLVFLSFGEPLMMSIKVKFKNGETWEVPAWKIATLRSQEYADETVGKFIDLPVGERSKHHFVAKAAYDEALTDKSILVNYLIRLNWDDVKSVSTLVSTGKTYDLSSAHFLVE